MADFYNVVPEDKACSCCEQGATWVIVGPDGVGFGTSYLDEDEAEEIAELMNLAFQAGMEANN